MLPNLTLKRQKFWAPNSKMCVEIENLLKNLHLLVMPSTLWGVHIDPKQEFIAIVHIDANYNKSFIDKGVLLTCENNCIKASVSLNDEIVELPQVMNKIELISDISSLLYTLQEIKFCIKCSKYNLNAETSNICSSCSVDNYNTEEVIRVSEIERNENLDFFDDVNFNNDTIIAPKETDFVCDLCNEKFISQDLLEKHLTIHDIQCMKSYLCTVCGKTFNTMYALEDHMITHSDDKPFKCKTCMKAFAKKYNLNVHIRVHSGERPYVCSKCGKTYSTRSNLSTHMNSAHCEEKRHACEFCQMTFVHPRVLRIHMRKHTGEKPFMCKICGKVFSKKIHLTIHTRTHTGEKPYVCTTCGKGFTTTGNLTSHRNINHKGMT